MMLGRNFVSSYEKSSRNLKTFPQSLGFSSLDLVNQQTEKHTIAICYWPSKSIHKYRSILSLICQAALLTNGDRPL